MTPEEFRRLGHELVDWVADYRERVAALPVMSRVAPGAIRALLPPEPPEHGESLAGIADEIDRILLPGVTHWNHPRFFAYFPSNASLASVLADIVSTGLGVQGMSWQTSPAATELEEVTLEWLRKMVDLPRDFTGVIHDTASTATLVALLSARERVTDHAQTRGGLQGETHPLAVYASDQAHSSVEKGALLAGFGREHLRFVATDAHFALDPQHLRKAIEDDLARGVRPCAVVATVGSTATTAIDPVAAIARIAAEHGLWLHVDAALAGTAMIAPECRPLWAGVERADSVVFNPHKWTGVAFDCTAYYVRDPVHLVRVMSTNPSYLRTAQDTEVTNYRDWSIQLGRRFRALKLWLVIRDEGVAGLRARIRRDMENARWLCDEVERAENWSVVAPVPLQTVCVRHEPPGMALDDVDAHNARWADVINASGAAYLTHAVVKGRRIVRVSIGALATDRGDVAAVWRLMRDTAEGDA
jgi:aromatic-L-amino-acid decarboxylase